MVEDSDAGSSQDEAFETEDRVKLVVARGQFKCKIINTVLNILCVYNHVCLLQPLITAE